MTQSNTTTTQSIERVLTTTIGFMRHHWLITGILALLIVGCATTDSQRDDESGTSLPSEDQPSSQRDDAGTTEPLPTKDDDTAAPLWLVVDNAESYKLHENKAKLSLPPGQHRIDLVEEVGGPPIHSICVSNNIRIERTFTVRMRVIAEITDNRGRVAMILGDSKAGGFYSCS